MKHTKLSCLL